MKTLVAYFSASGQTAKLAKTLAGVTGGDLFEIAPRRPTPLPIWTGWNKKEPQHHRDEGPQEPPRHRGQGRGYGASTTRCSWAFPSGGIRPRASSRRSSKATTFRQDRHPLCHLRRSGMGGEDVLRSACSKGTKVAPGKRLSSRERHGKACRNGSRAWSCEQKAAQVNL